MFSNVSFLSYFVTQHSGESCFHTSFYVSFILLFFSTIFISWWLLDFWVVNRSLIIKKPVFNFVILFFCFVLFFTPSLGLFVILTFFSDIYVPLTLGIFAFFGSMDSLSVLFVFMVHVVDGLTLVFLLLYYHPTTVQAKESARLYLWAIFLMTVILDCLFFSTNLLVMFFVAEFSLFPLSFLLLKENTIFWRSKDSFCEESFESKRPLAFYYLALFTVVSGGLGLIGLIIFFIFFGDLSFVSFKNLFVFDQMNFFTTTFGFEEVVSLHLAVFLVLLWVAVKVPLVPVHVWLPKAHVEGSTESSMLLAGIILKITTYIIIRLSECWFFSYFFSLFESFFLTMALTTVLFGALGALSTIDLKRLAAYSSVSHMGIILISGFLLSTSSFSLQPYVILLMTHTLISTSMFFTVGCIYKLRLKSVISRNRLTYSGLLFVYPYFFLIGLIFFANLNIPLTLGFVGELGVLVSAVQLGFSTSFCVLLGSFLLLIPMLMIIAQVLLGPVKTFEFENLQHFSNFTYFKFFRIYSELSYNSNQLLFHDFLKFILSSVSVLIISFGVFPFVFASLVNSANSLELVSLNSFSFFLSYKLC